MKIVADITSIGSDQKFTTEVMNYESVLEVSNEYFNLIWNEGACLNSLRQELESGGWVVLSEKAIKSDIFKFREV